MVLQEDINLLKEKIEQADSIVVGGASGMSAASGFIFYYQEDDVFKSLAGSLAKKYNRHNMFDLFYDQRPSRGEQWALMLRTIKYVYECQTGETYIDLAKLLNGKNYYIATTNQDDSIVYFLKKELHAYKETGVIGSVAVHVMTKYITIKKRLLNYMKK